MTLEKALVPRRWSMVTVNMGWTGSTGLGTVNHNCIKALKSDPRDPVDLTMLQNAVNTAGLIGD